MSAEEGTFCPLPEARDGGRILTRIYIQPDGNLLVTDLWEEVEGLLEKEDGFTHVVDPSL